MDKLVVPPWLKEKVSPGLIEFAQARIGVWVFGVTLAAILGTPHVPIRFLGGSVLRAFLHLLGPCVCPLVVAAIFTLFPPHPYRGIPWVTKTHPIDTSDPVALRLAVLYKSVAARRHLWGQAVKFSLILLAIIAGLQFAVRDAGVLALLNPARFASVGSLAEGTKDPLWPNLLGACLGSLCVLPWEVHAWCLRKWVAQETKRHRTEGA